MPEKDTYSVEELRGLYEWYHTEVIRHDLMSGVPCDEECGTEAFLDWLDTYSGSGGKT